MPYSIYTSRFSFLQFAESDLIQQCDWVDTHECLPVVEDEDVWFQFILQADTEEEANALCSIDDAIGVPVRVGIGITCADDATVFLQRPQRYRIGLLNVLYYWPHGLPGITGLIDIAQCFRIQVLVANQSFCSNCFQRIGSDCHTTVVQYSNDENAFGFNYCADANAAAEVQPDCNPEIITFTNKSVLTLPWTAFLQSKFGNTPTVETWIYDEGGELVRAGIRVALDTYPPTELRFDFGGNASGVIKIL